jgi:N-acetylmuramoyl-L-alanine amidase
MPKAQETNNLVIHCSAGFGNLQSIQSFWKNNLNWKSKGYHFIIDTDGTIYYLFSNSQVNGYTKDETKLNLELYTNGVRSFNKTSIHIAYIGGIENKGTTKRPIWKGKDTRTDAQKKSIDKCIKISINWLKSKGKDVSKNLGVVGHRDFSTDKDRNGIIASWERVKECPCFDAISEYFMYSSVDRRNKLPTLK